MRLKKQKRRGLFRMKQYEVTPEELSLLVKTKQDAQFFSYQLDTLSNLLYKNTKTVADILKETFTHEQMQLMLNLLQKNMIDGENKTEITEFFSFLTKSIRNLPIVSLTLAFAPSELLHARISEWLLKTTGKTMLINIHVDKNIIAGAIIEVKGETGDFSLRKQIVKHQSAQ